MNKELILFYVIKGFAYLVQRLPLPIVLGLGRWMGRLAYLLDHRHRTLAYANLKIAFSREKKNSEMKRILRKTFESYAQNLVELLRLPVINPFEYIHVEGRAYVDDALARGKGVIFLAMHFGSWELCNFIPQLFNHPYKVLVNPQSRYSRLDELLNKYRQKAGAGLLNPGLSTRTLLEALKKNEMVGMVVDQGGKTGNLVNFFGREASMSTGAIKMGLKLQVAVCFCILVREQGHHRLIIKPALSLNKDVDIPRAMRESLQDVVHTMETYIRKYPWEYMWFYKIWKYSKESTIVVLNDKKLGHRHQSLAFTQNIQQALAEREIVSHVEVVDITFRSSFMRQIFSLLSFFSHPWASQGRLRYLKWFLTPQSFFEVMRVKGDFVVSCGSSTAGVNYFLSQDYHAKSVVIQTPGIVPVGRFDLAVLPEHDRTPWLSRKDNILFTDVAVNYISKEYVQQQAQLLMTKFPALQTRRGLRMGVLLGGESKHFSLPPALAQTFIDQLKSGVDMIQGELLCTTSPRTSPATGRVIAQSLSDFCRCPFLVIAREHNIPEAVGGILGLSDVVLVTSDSISMVSEAVSCGKTVVVVKLTRRSKHPCKHDRFVDKLQRKGHIILIDAGEISQVIGQVGHGQLTTTPLCQHETILKAARDLI